MPDSIRMAATDPVHVFAYGSNMSLERMHDRVPRATVITTGFVSGRRLAFHKRSQDGSGKANAAVSGESQDRVWGVLFAMPRVDKRTLDTHEQGYATEDVTVQSSNTRHAAKAYVALPEFIDPSLRPYCWYHRFTTHGAVQHGLPESYRRYLDSFQCVSDADKERVERNLRLLSGDAR